MPVLLGRWRERELRRARAFRECGGLATAQVAELLDSTPLALLDKRYDSPEHLLAALHRGIKLRALRAHRDRTRHHRVLQNIAPAIQTDEHIRAWEQDPQRALLAQEDDLIIGEFLAELTPTERAAFALHADGRSWRAIATRLDLPENQARNALRSCERKRKRFLTLYETGRLCGYRSQTIASLIANQNTSQLALEQAFAHLRHCRVCQTQYQTNEAQLRARFDKRALALLPPMTLPHPTGLLDRLQNLLTRHSRLLPTSPIRERLIETVAGATTATKIAAAAIGAAAIATSATHAAPKHHTTKAHRITTSALANTTPLHRTAATHEYRRFGTTDKPHHHRDHTAFHPYTTPPAANLPHRAVSPPIPNHGAEEEFGFER